MKTFSVILLAVLWWQLPMTAEATGNAATDNVLLLAAAEDRQDRRQERGRSDERQDKRDCRQEEGRVGEDKRDCKQEEVRDGVRGNRGGDEDASSDD